MTRQKLPQIGVGATTLGRGNELPQAASWTPFLAHLATVKPTVRSSQVQAFSFPIFWRTS
jgi:hypothetical protein